MTFHYFVFEHRQVGFCLFVCFEAMKASPQMGTGRELAWSLDVVGI